MTFAEIVPPLLFAAFVWWFSTGAILWLDRLPRKTFVWSFGAVSVLAVLALFGLHDSAGRNTAADAYMAFSCVVALWGWHEMSFLMGYIVGPRREPCPAGARGWRRFRMAAATLMHHEIALFLTALLIVGLTWEQPNQVGVLTFLVLWVMRLSAKFNLFLGAPHRSEEMLPPHLSHLKSYFRHRRMNPLFPVSIATAGAIAFAFGTLAFAPDATLHQQAGCSLLLAITSLALIEHVFMFVPPPNSFLWGWAAPKPSAVSVPSNPPARQERLSASGAVD